MNERKRQIAGLYGLMEGYIDGDKRAFARLHRRMEPKLRGLLVNLVRSNGAVDDLVQLTLLKAHIARERFVLQGGDPDGAVQGWYFAIARNVAMDYLREQYRGKRRTTSNPDGTTDLLSELPDTDPTVEQRGEETERQLEIVQRVRDAIAALPPGQREVVELHKLRGMSMAEIASRLQVREGAVRVRAHRAYRALARLLLPKSLMILTMLGPFS